MELGVEEGFLDHGLAIVEGAVDFQGLHVAADRRQLLFLDLADAAFRIEQDHVDAVDVVEALGHGAAGVAAGGDEDGDFLVAEVGDGPGQEAGAVEMKPVTSSGWSAAMRAAASVYPPVFASVPALLISASSSNPLPRGLPTAVRPAMMPGPGTACAFVRSDQSAIL